MRFIAIVTTVRQVAVEAESYGEAETEAKGFTDEENLRDKEVLAWHTTVELKGGGDRIVADT